MSPVEEEERHQHHGELRECKIPSEILLVTVHVAACFEELLRDRLGEEVVLLRHSHFGRASLVKQCHRRYPFAQSQADQGGGGAVVTVEGADSVPKHAGLGGGVLHDVHVASVNVLGLGA